MPTTRPACRALLLLPAVVALTSACPDDPVATTTGDTATTTTGATTAPTGTTFGTTGTTFGTTDVTGTTLDTTGTTGAPVCPDDGFEPNESVAEAPPIGDGEIAAVICPGDTDTFALAIDRETYLSIVGYLVRDDGQIAIELIAPDETVIRRSSGQRAVFGYDPPQGVEAIHVRLVSPGTHFVQVSHVAGMDEIPYTFVVQRFVNDGP